MDTNKKVNKSSYSRKYALSLKKILLKMRKTNVFIYDLRPKDKFNLKNISGSKNIKFDDIKEVILNHKKTDKIIIVGEQERSYSVIVSWARKRWYLRTYVLEDGMINVKKRDLKK